jgi:hypothetical protein
MGYEVKGYAHRRNRRKADKGRKCREPSTPTWHPRLSLCSSLSEVRTSLMAVHHSLAAESDAMHSCHSTCLSMPLSHYPSFLQLLNVIQCTSSTFLPTPLRPCSNDWRHAPSPHLALLPVRLLVEPMTVHLSRRGLPNGTFDTSPKGVIGR